MGELTSKKFWGDAVVRAIRTMAQAAVGAIGAGAVLSDVDWLYVVSASATAGLVSVLMSIDRIGSAATPAAQIPATTQVPTEKEGGSHGDDV